MPVLPIGLFLRVGLNGIGWDTYEEYFWEQRLLSFSYAYIGLPALDAEKYLNGEHLLGAALTSLMKAPAERRAEIYLEALKCIAHSGDNDFHRYLLAECVEAYSKLEDEQRQRLQDLLDTDQYKEVRPMMITTYERGKIEGKIEGLRQALLRVLQAKFGDLSPETIRNVMNLTPESLDRLFAEMFKVESLDDLHWQV